MDETDVGALKEQLAQLEARVDMLSLELDRAVQLIDGYGATLGRHLKGVLADQGELARRVGNLERTLFRSD